MELKEKLVALRKEKGLTQSAVAEKLDVSRQAISRWESGYTPNTWRTTEFARALWTDSMSNVAFPGYIGFPATYPL